MSIKEENHIKSSVDDCRIIRLERHHHANGNLSVASEGNPLPFPVKRVYYTYDIPAGQVRGGHSHCEQYEFIVAACGSFSIELTDGNDTKRITLNRPYEGLLVTPGVWRTLDNFCSGSVCLVLASAPFDEADYVRSFEEFIKLTESKRQ